MTEEQRMRESIIEWARARWPGCRVLHELVLGERRIDLVFVAERDLYGMEIKSSVDTLARLAAQMKEYRRYLPEVWVAVALKWHGAADLRFEPNLLTLTSAGAITEHVARKPSRDELVCSRLLELLWRDEAAAIAVRTHQRGADPRAQAVHPRQAAQAVVAALDRQRDHRRSVP